MNRHGHSSGGQADRPSQSERHGPPSLRLEAVAQAIHGQRLLDMQGIDTQPREQWEADALEAAERYAIRHEGAGAGSGLVSVPTTHTRRPGRPAVPASVRADSERLLAMIDAVPANPARRMLTRAANPVQRVLDVLPIDTEARRLAQLRMHVGFAARGHCVNPSKGGDKCVMVTLTYAGDNASWNPSHVRDFLTHVRNWLARRDVPLRYVWVAELQARGVIHYHVALFLPADLDLPVPDEWFSRRMRGPVPPLRGGALSDWREAQGWPRVEEYQRECGWWPHGYSRIEVARAAVPYLLKYLSKDASKTLGSFPKGARLYGVGGLDFATRRARRWLGLPAFVRASGGVFDAWTRAKGGGWLAPEGTHYASEFRRLWVGDGPALVRLHRHGTAWPPGREPSGPYMWLTDRATAVAHAKGAKQWKH